MDWASWLGRRVVVRYRINETGGGISPALNDVSGELLQADEQQVVVRRDSGEEVQVPLAQITAGKPIPPRAVRGVPPHRSITVAELQTIMSAHWPAAHRQQLPGALLRADAGWTQRANSVLIQDPAEVAAHFDEFERRTTDFFQQHAIPPGLSLPVTPEAEHLKARLERSGWAPVRMSETAVYTAAPRSLMRAGEWAVQLQADPSPTWRAMAGYPSDTGLRSPDRALWLRAERQVFVSAHRPQAGLAPSQAPLAIARGSLASGWTMISSMQVHPEHRRAGAARTLIDAVARWGHAQRSVSLALEVLQSHAAAIELYESVGMHRHHSYSYWRRDALGSSDC